MIVLASGLLVTHFTRTATRFGPHHATARLAFDGRVTFDAGPLGSLTTPVDLPFGLGVDLVLQDIPEVAGTPRTSFTQDELQAYASLYTRPDADTARVQRALVNRFLLGCGVGLLVMLLLYLYPGRDRRRALARRLGGSVRAGIVVTTAVALTVGGYVTTQAITAPEASNIDRAFAGTRLEGATVHGRWMRLLVNDLGAQFLTFLDENRDFYATVERNARDAVSRTPLPKTGDHLTTVLLVEGLKCNQGMMGVIGALADQLDPGFVLSAGDDSLTSGGLEQLCIDALAASVRGHDVVIAPGNHDSLTSRRAMRGRGFTVLDGTSVTRAGLTILGDGDPRVDEALGVRSPLRNETIGEMSTRLAAVACEERDPVDVFVVNQPAGLERVLADGCTRLAIAGGIARDYTLQPSNQGRAVPRYLAASAGGAVFDISANPFATLGPLEAPAEITLLTFSRASHRPLQHHVLTVTPDRNVTISPPTFFPYGATAAGQRELMLQR